METADRSAVSDMAIEHFDVLIIGAGISGIGMACSIQHQMPEKSILILEAQESFGGTWWTHRYPGVRSDSDLFTFGYRFKPWTEAPIASAGKILRYMEEVITENHLEQHIRYQHRVERASWCSNRKIWTIEVTRTDTSERLYLTAQFLWMCQGYYDHREGYTPEWKGMEKFRGRIVHPQHWPEDLDYKNKSIIIIGSGATAVTLVPAMADEASHITLLQRSPTYFSVARNENRLADSLRELGIKEEWIHEIARRSILAAQREFTQRAFSEPEKMKEELLSGVRALLGEDYDVETHFTPRYRPWRQRIALVPNGDFLKTIASGRASVVTDEIGEFTESGILLRSGKALSADIIITATGFNLSVLGGIEFSVDGRKVNFAETVTYRGMMFTGVPNLIWIFGYFRASWTLRVDIVGDFMLRLFRYMQDRGARSVEVALRPEDRDMPLLPWVDSDNFNPGYLTRSLHLMPRSGSKPEWRHSQDYWADIKDFPELNLNAPEFVYR